MGRGAYPERCVVAPSGGGRYDRTVYTGDDGRGPYREAHRVPQVEARCRGGSARLVVGPGEMELLLGARWRLWRTGARIVIERGGAGRRHRHRRELDSARSRLWVARSFPAGDLAIWCEVRPGVVERLGGIRALPLLDEEAMAARRELDRLAAAAAAALAEAGGEAGVGAGPVREAGAGGAARGDAVGAGGAARGDAVAVGRPGLAVEVGAGQHRVLVVDRGDRLVVYARPLFRERPRRVLEVCADGGLVLPRQGRRGDRRRRFGRSRFRVTVSGDRVLFAADDGRDVASVWLPWIGEDERVELARRFGALVDPPATAAELAGAEAGAVAAPDQASTGLRPWRSGLGRRAPRAAYIPSLLPYLRR